MSDFGASGRGGGQKGDGKPNDPNVSTWDSWHSQGLPLPPIYRKLAGGRLHDAGWVVPRIQRHLALHPEAVTGSIVQRKSGVAGDAAGGVKIPDGGGAPLPRAVQAKMQQKLGTDLSDTRVHTGGDSASASADLNAEAFTVGSDVHFNAGKFDPDSKEGEKLLAHELTHVAQNKAGNGVQRKVDEGEAPESADGEQLEVSDPEEPAEKEADEKANAIVEGRPTEPVTRAQSSAGSAARKAWLLPFFGRRSAPPPGASPPAAPFGRPPPPSPAMGGVPFGRPPAASPATGGSSFGRPPGAAPGLGGPPQRPLAARPGADPAALMAELARPMPIAGRQPHSMTIAPDGDVIVASDPLRFPALMARIQRLIANLPNTTQASITGLISQGTQLYNQLRRSTGLVVRSTQAPSNPIPPTATAARTEEQQLANIVGQIFAQIPAEISWEGVGFRAQGEPLRNVLLQALRNLRLLMPDDEIAQIASRQGTAADPTSYGPRGFFPAAAGLAAQPPMRAPQRGVANEQRQIRMPGSQGADQNVVEERQGSVVVMNLRGRAETYARHVANFAGADGMADRQLAGALLLYCRTQVVPPEVPAARRQDFLTFAQLLFAREGATEITRNRQSASLAPALAHPQMALSVVRSGGMTMQQAFANPPLRPDAEPSDGITANMQRGGGADPDSMQPTYNRSPDNSTRPRANADGPGEAQRRLSRQRQPPPDGRAPFVQEYVRRQIDLCQRFLQETARLNFNEIVFENEAGAIEYIQRMLQGFHPEPPPAAPAGGVSQ